MADNDEKLKQIEKIMGEPMALEPTDYEERIRRNLLIISCLALMSWGFGATPVGHIEIWGLSFEHLDIRALSIVALLITLYQFFHYGWVVFNKFAYWRVRLTGVKHPIVRGNRAGYAAHEDDPSDYKGDEKNSNLYVWIIERAARYHALIDSLAVQYMALESIKNELGNADPISEQRINEAIASLDGASKRLADELNNLRVSESLRRFDSWFHMMVLSQSIRWIVLDLLIPLVLGLMAIIGLSLMIYGNPEHSVSQACLPLFDNSLI